VRGGTGVASGYVYHENAKSPDGEPRKRDTQAIEVTWDATGRTTAEWRADLAKETS